VNPITYTSDDAATDVEGIVRKYECGSGRENMRAAVREAYMLGTATERERCASICDDMVLYTGHDCAARIREGN